MQHRISHLFPTMALVFIAVFAIYLACAAPGVMYGDSAELQAVALDGGIAHPTGYPTFIMLGRAFGAALGGEPAHRITVMSAVFGAASVCALILVLLKFGLPLRASAAGALIYALSFTFFWSSIRSEVYTVAVFIFLAGLWLTLHALERPNPLRAAFAGMFMGLTLTGHLAFAPAVAVVLITLALAAPAGGGSRIGYLAALAGAFVAGLLPYAYLFWADAAGYPMNYLDYTIEATGGQYGFTPATFDDPWERIPWLIFGAQSRPVVFLVHPRPMLWQALRVVSIEFIYHFGPVALPLFVIGVYQALRRLRRRVWLLFGMIVASAIFGAGFGSGRMLQIFLIPSTVGVAVTVSFGIWLVTERFAMRSPRRGAAGMNGDPRMRWAGFALLAMLVLGIVAVPHAMRVGLQDSSAFPEELKMHVEGEPEIRTFVPRLNGFREPRRYGEKALELIPENALVVGKWKEIMVLYYLHYIEGARPDIALDPYYPEHYVRLNRWQERHDLATRPIVFLRHPSELFVDIAAVDTIRAAGGQSIYVRSASFEPLSLSER